MIDSLGPPLIDLRKVGRHLPRPRSQRGGKLAHGRYWARWRIYCRAGDGREQSKRAEKIIDRGLAEQMGFSLDYTGPLNKTDARRVLDRLIRDSNAAPVAFNAKTTFGDLARESIDLNKPNWGENTTRGSENLIEVHLIGGLGARLVRELEDATAELQRFINA
jgi:hypothetical protein